MRGVAGAVLSIWLGLGGMAVAQSQPVAVVELYTSQGCSSCPPADEYLASIADRDDVIALSLHVDYWDYLGWNDNLADPAFAKRQRGYAVANGHRTVYTPQMIISGQDQVIGNSPGEVTELIRAHNAKSSPVELTLKRDGGVLQIAAVNSSATREDLVVQLVRYSSGTKVDIGRGENAGRSIVYRNVVTSWALVGNWDGSGDYAAEAAIKGDDQVVVIVQQRNFGPILAAARLK